MKATRRQLFQTVGLAGVTSLGSAGGAETTFPSLEILKVADEPSKVVVETTGAVFSISRTNPARLEITQKINGPRPLCAMEWDVAFTDLTLDFQDKEQCVLYVPVGDFGFNVRIFGDSLLSIRTGKQARVRTRGEWVPEYSYSEAGNLLFLDRQGGYGQYLIPSAHPYGSAFEEPKTGLSFSGRGWESFAALPPTRRLLASVAPPRPYDRRSSVEDRIVFHFLAGKYPDGSWNYYPSDETIQEYARHGNILHLHAWQGGAGPVRGKGVRSRVDLYAKAAPWAAWKPEPVDRDEFARVVRTAHRYGMRVTPYLSPLFFPGNSREFLAQLSRLLETYEIDGVYFDGVSEDIQGAYETMKGTRRLLGPDRLLFVHIPSPIIGSSYSQGRYVYCPFIDTYANFVLRAEHIDTFDDKVLRYTISGHNISNAIGFACNYDYEMEFNRALIRRVLDYEVRVPYWAGFDIYLAERGKAMGKQYPPMAAIQEAMVQDYFPALDRLKGKLR